ncbi:MAG: CRTAC1 family protein [Cyanobacteriota bacterium]|nr:CRTAC1 family protein [Cyanobacteriota bacterium]
MKTLITFVKRHLKRFVAVLIVVSLFSFTRLPALSATERDLLASHFKFTALPLPELAGVPKKFARSVHPSLEQHSAWISAVGAAVALNDLDGDGLPNDVCYVDPRSDRAIVAPIPGTVQRYDPFSLDPSLSYDASTMAPMGCLPGDLNEDGAMDIIAYYWGRTPIAFLHRGANEQFLGQQSYTQQEVVPIQERWYTNAATFADLDGDGHNDLVIGNYFQDNAEILNANGTGEEEMQHSMTRAYNGGRDRILRWTGATAGTNPTVQFADISGVLDEQVARGWTLAVGAADLDGDLLPELYFANDFGPDRLLHNRSQPGQMQFALLEGQKHLTTPNSKVLGRDSFKGMGVDFADINRDGLFDIYVSNIAAEYALEESHFLFTSTGETDKMKQGIAPYDDSSEPLGLSRSGWGWETKFGDFNNDGTLEALQATGFAKGEVNRWPELHELAMGNDQLLSNPKSWFRFQVGDDLNGNQPNPFFVQGSDGRYYNLAQELGLNRPQVTRGIATADVDGDGDLDFAIANQWDTSYFYRNESQNSGAFLELRLQQLSGSPAVGAIAKVSLPNGQKLIARVDGGNGHSGARSPELHFGLGEVNVESQLPVEVQWRDTEGQARQASFNLSSGVHTVLLGQVASIDSK